MTRCPSCNASVHAGETICEECGTELVIVVPVAGTSPAPAAQALDSAPSGVPVEDVQPCPDCGSRVVVDVNGSCPVCGFDFESPTRIDEASFFRPEPAASPILPPPRTLRDANSHAEHTPTVARSSLPTQPVSSFAAAAPAPGDRVLATPSSGTPPRPSEATSTVVEDALPGDRRRRFGPPSGEFLAVSGTATLVVEGGQTVFYDGRMTERILLDVDQLVIGRRDPTVGHYPEIDLTHLRHLDGHLSRRHARVFRHEGRWWIQDLAQNDATFVNDHAHGLNGEAVPLQDGDRVLVGAALVLRYLAPRATPRQRG